MQPMKPRAIELHLRSHLCVYKSACARAEGSAEPAAALSRGGFCTCEHACLGIQTPDKFNSTPVQSYLL
ncbi:hypothetical protein MHYP_G00284180 [Metynnis hypsauchen]